MLCWPQGQPAGETEHPHNHVQTAAERLTLQEPQMPGLHAGFPTLCPLGLPWAAEQAPLVSFLAVPPVFMGLSHSSGYLGTVHVLLIR